MDLTTILVWGVAGAIVVDVGIIVCIAIASHVAVRRQAERLAELDRLKQRNPPDRHFDRAGNVLEPDPYVMGLIARDLRPESLADLAAPPADIDYARVGDVIEIDRTWTENGYPMGDRVVVGEVIGEWTRGR